MNKLSSQKMLKIVIFCAIITANKPSLGWSSATVTLAKQETELSSVAFKTLHRKVQKLQNLLVKIEQCIEKVAPLYRFLTDHPEYTREILLSVEGTTRYYWLKPLSRMPADLSSSTIRTILDLLDKSALDARYKISIQDSLSSTKQ